MCPGPEQKHRMKIEMYLAVRWILITNCAHSQTQYAKTTLLQAPFDCKLAFRGFRLVVCAAGNNQIRLRVCFPKDL